jgi:hypothetical protein
MRWLYAPFLFLLCPLYIFSQEYSYSHYDGRDGLGSSTVYCITQDKDGFLWFATETGLSRFDGTHFRNFTEEDGLPDNDVIQVFADSKGRVWFSPFRKTVCYYYKGTIHNSENDSLLKKLRLNDNVFQFAEDAQGNILLKETTRLHIINASGDVNTIFANGDKPLGYITQIAARTAGGFFVFADDKMYVLENNRFTLWKTVQYELKHFNYASFSNEMIWYRNTPDTMSAISIPENKARIFPFLSSFEFINCSILDNRYSAVCLRTGALVYDLEHPGHIQHYLPGIPVSNMFADSEGNWWFCTLGKGVYRLNSAVVLNVTYSFKNQADSQSNKFASLEWTLANKILKVVRKYAALPEQSEGLPAFTWYNSIPILNILFGENNTVILGSRHFLQKITPDFSNSINAINFFSVKALCRHKKNILVASEKNVLLVDPKAFKIIDTIWRERATCLFSNNDTIYIGTMNGLFQLTPDKKVQYLGENIKALKSRVVAVSEDANHIVWVATTGAGLIGWRNGQVVKRISRNNGLSSNICRTLFYEKGNLWVGTNNGLNKINVLQSAPAIKKYSSSDGLLSDIINSVYVINKKVFVGTPEGITFFDEEKISSQSRCDLRIVDVTIGNETFHPSLAPVNISHAKNSIQFNYVGISYKSNGDIRYRYRLLGLDSAWKDTKETFLSYPTLPSGDYQLQLQAINKFDVRSQIMTAGFTIEKLLYERTWFRLLIGLLFLAATGLLVWIIIRRIRKREREKTTISKRIGELEQLSRKAQMNPHFIFNSLNSIQQYVMDADVAGANKFISGFSRLIRQTLDFSSKPEISLEEELDYLTNYLEIEKTRLENAFSWAVFIEGGVDQTEYYIPPMILQPFVENSVRHGLRFRKDKAGIVTIRVRREGDHLTCILEDNGIGRKAAMQYKSISPINYQSKGLSLTADRIAMFNQEHEQKITMQIDDLEDDRHNALGTRVTISFPVM